MIKNAVSPSTFVISNPDLALANQMIEKLQLEVCRLEQENSDLRRFRQTVLDQKK